MDLGRLPGDTDSTAVAINAAGQVIGLSVGADGSSRPFLWQNGEMVELASLLDASGAGWTIKGITAINNAGQVTGFGMRDGRLRGFVMTPVAP